MSEKLERYLRFSSELRDLVASGRSDGTDGDELYDGLHDLWDEMSPEDRAMAKLRRNLTPPAVRYVEMVPVFASMPEQPEGARDEMAEAMDALWDQMTPADRLAITEIIKRL